MKLSDFLTELGIDPDDIDSQKQKRLSDYDDQKRVGNCSLFFTFMWYNVFINK